MKFTDEKWFMLKRILETTAKDSLSSQYQAKNQWRTSRLVAFIKGGKSVNSNRFKSQEQINILH